MLKSLYALFLLIPSLAAATLDGPNDFQFWNKELLQIRLKPHIHIYLDREFRWGDNASTLYYKHIQALYGVAFASYFQIIPGFRQSKWRTSKHSHWMTDNSPLVDFIVELPVSSCLLADRNRFQYRFISKLKVWRYRNCLSFYFPLVSTRFKLRPYISNEVFFDEHIGFSQNRSIAGLTMPFSRQLLCYFFYDFRMLKRNEHWIHQNILGLYLRVEF